MMKRWVYLVVGFSTVILLLPRCSDNPLAPDLRGENEVWIQSQMFVPKTLTVSVGTTVTWTNKDNETHSIDSGTFMHPTQDFHSPNLEEGEKFPFTFSGVGTFPYYCVIHQNRQSETGTIVVEQ